MSSPLLALFVRSLREDARLKLTYVVRAGLVVVVAVFMVLTVLASGWTGAPGLQFFRSIAFIQAAFITLAGCSYFASAITEEKEEQTLGLLRMTNLDPLSILLGKSTSRLCGALLLLAAQVPFTLLAVTLGGVTSRQVFATYLALGAYAFFLSNLALLASVVARRTGGAAALVAGPVMTLVFFGKVQFFPSSTSPLWSGLSLLWNSAAGGLIPFDRMETILRTAFAGSLIDQQFWSSVLVGLACFSSAWLLFERCGELDSGLGALRAQTRRHFPPGRVGTRPIVWKDFNFIHGGRLATLAKFVSYPLTLVAILFTDIDFSSIPKAVTDCGTALVWVAGSIFTLELGFAASRLFRVEVRDRTWSSLALASPSTEALYEAKVASCYYPLFPSVLTIAIGVLIALVGSVMSSGSVEWGVLVVLLALIVALYQAKAASHSRFLPAVFAVAIGMLIAFLGVVISSNSTEREVIVMLVALAFVGMRCVLFFYPVAWLSLLLPRGALPLGIVLVFLFDLLGVLVSFLTFGLGFLALPFVPLIVAQHFKAKLLERLDQLIAEG